MRIVIDIDPNTGTGVLEYWQGKDDQEPLDTQEIKNLRMTQNRDIQTVHDEDGKVVDIRASGAHYVTLTMTAKEPE